MQTFTKKKQQTFTRKFRVPKGNHPNVSAKAPNIQSAVLEKSRPSEEQAARLRPFHQRVLTM